MENRLMIFKRCPEDGEIAKSPRDSGAVCYSHNHGNFYIAIPMEPTYQCSSVLCNATKQDIFSCLTDEEIDAEYRRRLIGKTVPFDNVPVGCYVLLYGKKRKVILREGDRNYKTTEIDGKVHLIRSWEMVEVCEPPEQKKNEELSDLIKSMEEMISIAKKHLEDEE